MAFNIGSITGFLFQWMKIGLFWILIIIGALFGVIGWAVIRKRKKLTIPVLEVISIGAGKVAIKDRMAGWFKSRWFLGLIDYGGTEKLLLKDKREIQNASSEDYHNINGKEGLIIQRKGDDPQVLVPISKIELKNKELLMEIAPADFRDTSVKLMRQAENETISKFAQYLPYIAVGIGIIILFVVVLVVINYAKSSQAEAWKNTQEAIKLAYQNRGTVIESVAPLIIPLLFWKKRKEINLQDP